MKRKYFFIVSLIAFISLNACERNDINMNAKFAGVWKIKEFEKQYFSLNGSIDSSFVFKDAGMFFLYNSAYSVDNHVNFYITKVNGIPVSKITASSWYVGLKHTNRIVFNKSFSLSVEKITNRKHKWVYYEDIDAYNVPSITYKEIFTVEKLRSNE